MKLVDEIKRIKLGKTALYSMINTENNEELNEDIRDEEFQHNEIKIFDTRNSKYELNMNFKNQTPTLNDSNSSVTIFDIQIQQINPSPKLI